MENNTILNDSLFVKTRGFSMQPFIRFNDKIIVKRIRAGDLRIGDIILYKDTISGKTICHRFVKKVKSKDKLMLFARGDAGFLSEPVLENNLIGRVIGIIRDGKILNLRTRHQIVLNRLNAKFYIFFKKMMTYIFILLQNFSLYKKLLNRITHDKIEFKQFVIKDNKDLVSFDCIWKDNHLVNPVRELRSASTGDDHRLKSAAFSNGVKASSYRFMAMYKNFDVASVVLDEIENDFFSGWWIVSLYVRLPFQGIGIGEKLIQKALKFAKDINIPFIYLDVYDKNIKATNLYRKLGFKEVTTDASDICPPSQKTTGLSIDECEVNASADVTDEASPVRNLNLNNKNVISNGASLNLSADNPALLDIKHNVKLIQKGGVNTGTTGLPVGFHLKRASGKKIMRLDL